MIPKKFVRRSRVSEAMSVFTVSMWLAYWTDAIKRILSRQNAQIPLSSCLRHDLPSKGRAIEYHCKTKCFPTHYLLYAIFCLLLLLQQLIHLGLDSEYNLKRLQNNTDPEPSALTSSTARCILRGSDVYMWSNLSAVRCICMILA